MTKCDCCGQEAESLYLVMLTRTSKPGFIADVIWDKWEPSATGEGGWLCSDCEYVIRIMASIGWFTRDLVRASMNWHGEQCPNDTAAGTGGNRLIGSLEMW